MKCFWMDQEILDILNFGFPRLSYDHSNYFDDLDDLAFLIDLRFD